MKTFRFSEKNSGFGPKPLINHQNYLFFSCHDQLPLVSHRFRRNSAADSFLHEGCVAAAKAAKRPPRECQERFDAVSVNMFTVSGWGIPTHIGVSKNRGGSPKWMVKLTENLIKMDDLGVPPFSETPITMLVVSIIFIVSPIWVNDPNWQFFFKRVESTD